MSNRTKYQGYGDYERWIKTQKEFHLKFFRRTCWSISLALIIALIVDILHHGLTQ